MQCDAVQYIAQTLCKAYAIYRWENKALISIIQIKLKNLIIIMDNVTLRIVMDDSKYMDLSNGYTIFYKYFYLDIIIKFHPLSIWIHQNFGNVYDSP